MTAFPFLTFVDYSVYPCLICRGEFEFLFQVFDPRLQNMLRGEQQVKNSLNKMHPALGQFDHPVQPRPA